jgi:hypothetical protein
MLRHLAVVRETSRVDAADLTRVAAALQKQALNDFAPVWNRPATVDAFLSLDDVPTDYWPMIVRDDIPYNAQGIHLDNTWGPYSLIRWDTGWSLTASHECLEMLADPYGRRLRTAPSPKAGQGEVQFLVEVCDPCEAEQFAYEENGVVVSDFYTRAYFGSAGSAARYSFTGAVTRPRQVLRGGYLSWRVPSTGAWWQKTFFGSSPAIVNLGRAARGQTAREFTDGDTKVPKPFLTPKRRRAAGRKAAGGATLAAGRSPMDRARDLRANVRRIAGI